uniref:Uncharacterized protein n=1 Tax=Oryza nivara TaxID=4536 RepID=A0A0E0IP52_ORYNI
MVARAAEMQAGSGSGGARRIVEARTAVWRPVQPVEMRPAAWRGGRCGLWSVEAGSVAWNRVRHVERGGRLNSVEMLPTAGGRRWRKPCRAFGRFDDDDAVGAVSLLEGVIMALSHLPHKSPGENLAPVRTSGGGVTRHVLLGASLRGSSFTSMTIDGLFGSKAFFPWCSARPKPLGSTSFCGGRHTLRLFLRIKSELLAVGVRRRLATMTCCSLFQRVGAGHVKEVALWWLG